MLTVSESPDAVVWAADTETTKRILGSVVTHQELCSQVPGHSESLLAIDGCRDAREIYGWAAERAL